MVAIWTPEPKRVAVPTRVHGGWLYDDGQGDPTLVVHPIPKCAYTSEELPDTNFGSDWYLSWGVFGTKEDDYALYVLLEADISAIPGNATILSTSKLELYIAVYHATSNGECGTLWVPIVEAWDEDTVTHNDMPAGSIERDFEIADPTGTGWFTFGDANQGADIATFLQYALDNESGVARWYLRPIFASLEGFEAYSDDYAVDPSRRPKLTVNYTVPGARRIFITVSN